MTASVQQLSKDDLQLTHMRQLLAIQQQGFRSCPYPDLASRRRDLHKLKSLLVTHQDELAAAISQDFGSRSIDETRLAEILTSVEGINTAAKQLKTWMTPSKRRVGLLFAPASNQVIYQPLGVIGIVVPWNYPLYLTLGPLTTALAAGNRAMIKLSEYTPAFNACLTPLIETAFPNDQVAVISGDAQIAANFTSLPFDHLLFTGATSIGRHVMRAAAENLTPVTLELGGKSPVIIDSHADIDTAAERICFGKSLNGGQTCVAPDYVLCPEDKQQAFIDAYRRAFSRMYPTVRDNSDYSAIINDRQHQRLQALIEDARQQGATLTTINPATESFDQTRKMPPVLVEHATDQMMIMQEEIFGPLLPIVPYQQLSDAIDYINDRPRPLALYLFSDDRASQQQILHQTHSGGVTINNTLTHLAQDDMPFGGIGDSGMGHYHGYEGFLNFSKAKSVHKIGRFNSGKLAYPPYNRLIHKLIYKLFIK